MFLRPRIALDTDCSQTTCLDMVVGDVRAFDEAQLPVPLSGASAAPANDESLDHLCQITYPRHDILSLNFFKCLYKSPC